MARRLAILQALTIIPTQSVAILKAELERNIPAEYSRTRSAQSRVDSRVDAPITLNYALGKKVLPGRRVVTPYGKVTNQDKLDYVSWTLSAAEEACNLPVRIQAFGTDALCTTTPESSLLKLLKYKDFYEDAAAKSACDIMQTNMNKDDGAWDNTWYKDQYIHMAHGSGTKDLLILKWLHKSIDSYKNGATTAAATVKSCLKAFGLLVRGNKVYFDWVGTSFLEDMDGLFKKEIEGTPTVLAEALDAWAFYQDSQDMNSKKDYKELELFSEGMDKLTSTDAVLAASYWSALTSYVCHLEGAGSALITRDLRSNFKLVSLLEKHNGWYKGTEAQTQIFHVLGCWTDTKPISEWLVVKDREDELITLAHSMVKSCTAANSDYWRCLRGLQVLKNILPISPWIVQKIQNAGLMEGIIKAMKTWKPRLTAPFLPDLYSAAAQTILPAIKGSSTCYKIALDGDVPEMLVEAMSTVEPAGKKAACSALKMFSKDLKAHNAIVAMATVLSTTLPAECTQ